MEKWKDKKSNIEWYYDLESPMTWKSTEQIDKGYRLPTVQEVLTLLDYDNDVLLDKKCPFDGKVWTNHLGSNDLRWAVDLDTGQVYRSTKNNRRLILLIKE
jgi:hypothetical protein